MEHDEEKMFCPLTKEACKENCAWLMVNPRTEEQFCALAALVIGEEGS